MNINNDNSRITAALTTFLANRLPALGLDAELYGPYVLSLLVDDDTDDWTSVLELLRASSETHADDDACWNLLRCDATQEYKRIVAAIAAANEQEVAAADDTTATTLTSNELTIAAASDESARSALEHSTTTTSSTKTTTTDNAVKQAVLSRFAYDEEDDDDDDEEDSALVAVQPTAAKPNHPVVKTKQLARHETAVAKQNKIQAKEDRRKRATKQERKR
jgi:hypothetical protein